MKIHHVAEKMKFEELSKAVKKASIKHAKKVLGEEQYEENKDAAKSVKSDFSEGALFVINSLFIL